MPKEKKSKPTSDSQQKTRVLLEQISSDVKTVSEQHGSIMGKLQEHDQRFNKIEIRLDNIDLKLLSHDGKFKDLEARFDRVEARLSSVEGRLSSVEGRLSSVEGRLGRVEGKIDRIENVITGVMSEHETRIKKIEEKITII